MKTHLCRVIGACIALTAATSAQEEAPEKPYLDKILERETFTPQETEALNQDVDPVIDVRDLVIFLNGQAISATFGTAETIAYHADGSVSLPIYFSKPIPSATAIHFDLGGNAVSPDTVGVSSDYTLTYLTTVPAGASSHQLIVNFSEQWNGNGGEKVIRLTINRDPEVIPQNGTFSTHLIRVRQFDAGEFVGSLSFEGNSILSAIAVRVGLHSDGTAVFTFQPQSAILGEHLTAAWSLGFESFPAFSQEMEISIPGTALGKQEPINADLKFVRLGEPHTAANAAYLEGFEEDNQPAVYAANLSIHDLFAAGNATSNSFTVHQTGRLVLQPVQYLNSDAP